jgi:methionyl-tRNA formyltransferase
LRVVFLGSGRFAIPSLEALLGSLNQVVAVVTQPDKEQGRGRAVAAPPLKPVAVARGLQVLQPRRIRAPEAVSALRELGADLHVVVAYGQILPKDLLELPPRGTLNVHASLLPRYRGAAPVQWAIVEGEAETGVTTMLLDEGLDTGPTLLARRTPIGAEETAAQLEGRLARLGAELLIETLSAWSAGSLRPTPQDNARATHARLLKKEDGRVDWGEPAAALERKVRGFQPWPGMTASLAGRGLRILCARVEPGAGDAPGTVMAVGPAGVVVACGARSRLRLIEVQPDSRRAMPAAAFAAGARLRDGQRFD